MNHAALLLILVAGSCTCTTTLADSLPRRADLGAGIAPPADGKPPRIVRFRPDSSLERAGVKVGDELIAMRSPRAPRVPGDPATDANAFGAFIRSLRAGDTLAVTVKRAGAPQAFEVRLPAMREEAVEGVAIRYGEAVSEKGYRVRTYTARPLGAAGKLPLVVFIPWLSCGAVENPLDVSDGWSKMLRDVMRDAGAQLVRIEKPGVGDSEGPDCSAADLSHDLAAFRAGIRAALADPGADPKRFYLMGGSVGGALAPVLARDFEPRGLIVTGGFSRTWYEHMLDIERRRLTLAGRKPAEVNAAMKAFAPFYERVLIEGLTPAQAIARNPVWKPFWYDGAEHQYGRPIRYYQELQALDVEGAWERIAVPTLIVWGEHDWIMGRDESERVAAILGPKANYVVRPGMNHHFDVFPDAAAAFREEGGAYDAGAARAMVEWLRRH